MTEQTKTEKTIRKLPLERRISEIKKGTNASGYKMNIDPCDWKGAKIPRISTHFGVKEYCKAVQLSLYDEDFQNKIREKQLRTQYDKNYDLCDFLGSIYYESDAAKRLSDEQWAELCYELLVEPYAKLYSAKYDFDWEAIGEVLEKYEKEKLMKGD